MFKKIEIWILYLVILLGLPVTIFFGVLVRQELTGKVKLGWVSKSALFMAEIPVNIRNAFALKEKVELQIEDRFPLLDGFDGIPNLSESYLLLSRYDGDLKEGIVELIDLMNFKVIHTWNPNIDEFNKSLKNSFDFPYINRDNNNSRQVLKHPKLTRDGGLLYTSRGPLRKIDACSNLIFQNEHDEFHHSIETDIEGNIWVPSWMYPQSLSEKKVGRKHRNNGGFNDDAIVKLSPDGEILYEKSLSQIFIDNGLEYLLFSVGDMRYKGNIFHLNDIQPVDYNGDFWMKGDVFLSVRLQSMVLLYRPSTNKIIWKGTGPFFHQHDVDILDDHRISILNNNSKYFADGYSVDGNSQVIIYDFKLDKYSYYLNDSLAKNDVKTFHQGRSQILSNGDLFIEEQTGSRIIYFDSDGSLRWSYLNRADNGLIYNVAWSRIIYNKRDLEILNNFLLSKDDCNA